MVAELKASPRRGTFPLQRRRAPTSRISIRGHARAGYIARWLVDIGDDAKEDRLLAELETLELGQQSAAVPACWLAVAADAWLRADLRLPSATGPAGSAG